MTDRTPNFAKYYRQGAACLALAQLTDISCIRVRWLRMARTWFRLAEKTIEPAIEIAAKQPAESDASNVIPLRSA